MANGNNCYKCAGLDARAAAIVMRCVRNTVNTGRTVVCTIHQPSIDIFEAFDDLLLMKSGGYVTYHGTLGKNSCKLIAYFEVSLLLLYISAQKLYLLARLQLVCAMHLSSSLQTDPAAWMTFFVIMDVHNQCKATYQPWRSAKTPFHLPLLSYVYVT